EHRYFCADSSALRIFHVYGSAVRDADGRVLLVGTAQDVTEQRAAVSRMERSSQRFSDLVSVTPVGIGLFDSAGQLVDVNEALCELLGQGAEQLHGRTVHDLAHAEE